MNQPSGFRRVVRDIADLCELQLELLVVDGQVAARRSGAAAVMMVIASIFGLSASIAIVFALASLLHEQAEWTISSSLLAAASVAAIIGGMFLILGAVIFRKAKSALEDTRGEFVENLRWIKAAIVAPETSSEAQMDESSRSTRTSVGYDRRSAMNGNFGKSHDK